MEKKVWLKHLPTILTVSVILLAVFAALFLKDLFFKEEVKQKKMVQQITVIAPPPPPPPPPEEIKEPEVQEEQIEEDLEEPTPDDSPDESVSEDIGLDADGEAGTDGFGLKAKKGGRGFLGGGGYGSYLKSEVNKALLKDKKIRSLAYRAKVTLWVESDGSISRYEIDILDGSQKAKGALERFFSNLESFSKPKPLEEESNWFSFKITSVI